MTMPHLDQDPYHQLKSSLDDILAHGQSLLRHLETASYTDASPSPSPHQTTPIHLLEDPSNSSIQHARKRLVESATKLLQLTTTAEGYLEHLANSVLPRTILRPLAHPPQRPPSPPHHYLAAVPAPRRPRPRAPWAVANGLLHEPAPGHVAHTRVSARLLYDAHLLSWARWMVTYSVPVAFRFADATRRWGDSDATNQTAFNLALDTPDPFFAHVRKSPELTAIFADYMRSVAASRAWSLAHAVDSFDWRALPDGAKVVDVGGSHGQLAVQVAARFPALRFVVQDLPETVADAQKAFATAVQIGVCDESKDNDTTYTNTNTITNTNTTTTATTPRIRFMAHDFFQPQPVVDAHVYFLRMILHDWPDREARLILQQLRAVLEKRPQARIVIMDTLLPPPGSTSILHEQQLRVRDLMMMQVFNARERELDDWKALLHGVGLRITHLEQPDDSVMGLLTVQLDPVANNAHVKSMTLGKHLQDTPPPRTPPPTTTTTCTTTTPTTTATTTTTPATTPTTTTTTRTADHPQPPVLIIGAGISGLCLAQALRKSNIPFRLFERDPALDARPQGYRLKLQADAAAALRHLLPDFVYAMFQSSCAALSVGETDLDPFTALMARSRSGGGLSGTIGLHPHYCVDRAAFRRILMTGIEQHVSFGKELASYSHTNHGGDCNDQQDEKRVVTATFTDGESVSGRFLVGADGLHSVIRHHQQQPQQQQQRIPASLLRDTGAACIYGKTPITPALLSRFPEKGLRWMTVISDHAPMLQSCFIGDSPVTLLLEPIRFSSASRAQHRLPDDYLYWALIGPEPRFRFPNGTSASSSKGGGNSAPGHPEASTDADAAALSLAVTEEWHPSIRCVFELQDPRQATLIRVVSALPDIPAWPPSSTVTVLGDAVHPMSPCGGIGAQTAICDAAGLAEVLGASRGYPSSQAIGAFERDMRKRAWRSIKHSEMGSRKMFGLGSLADCKPWMGWDVTT